MIETVKPKKTLTLDDYEAVAHLAGAVRELRREAAAILPQLAGRTLWMVNSTATGGGVAEMLPRLVSLLGELGLPTRWAVIHASDPEFFRITKKVHNLIHGVGEVRFTAAERKAYEQVNRENAADLRRLLGHGDILAVHDPQPMALGAMLKEALALPAIWRCHIGLDRATPETDAAWRFLEPYARVYDRAIFSAPEYIPPYCAGRASVIHPAIDPLSHKNRHLSPVRIMGILCDAGLALPHCPVVGPAFSRPAQRLQPDGAWGAATEPDEIGFLFRPIVSQISRWDRLKGWRPLLEGFARMKETARRSKRKLADEHARERLELVRLVLAGPDPASIQDDPEGREVLDDLRRLYTALPPATQRDIVLLSLPMASRKENALMVNAIQSCSSVVAQNSLQEGFGLTATEAMYKRVAVLGTHACGLRQQIRHGVDGWLVQDPTDPAKIADALLHLLSNPKARAAYARSAQRRAHDEFLVFTQARRWLEVLAETVALTP